MEERGRGRRGRRGEDENSSFEKEGARMRG